MFPVGLTLQFRSPCALAVEAYVAGLDSGNICQKNCHGAHNEAHPEERARPGRKQHQREQSQKRGHRNQIHPHFRQAILSDTADNTHPQKDERPKDYIREILIKPVEMSHGKQLLQQAARKRNARKSAHEVGHAAVWQLPLDQNAKHIGIQDHCVNEKGRRKYVIDDDDQEAAIFPLPGGLRFKIAAEHWGADHPDKQLWIDVPLFAQV